LFGAEALLLGRLTYEGLSAAYPEMHPNAFVDRMNSIPKFVALTTIGEASWNSSVIKGDVAAFVVDLNRQSGGDIVKYGNGPLDVTLMEHSLIDEFHILLTPVATGNGHHLFQSIENAPTLELVDVTRFRGGVLRLIYAPR
jgi:dihydrofolate reductase